MRVESRHRTVRTLALLFCIVPAIAHAEPPVHGRISYDAEGTYLLGKNDADWAQASLNTLILPGDSIWVDRENTNELELASGTYLRMAHEANIEIVTLAPDIHVRGLTGSFYIHRLRDSAGGMLFQTPAADVIAPPRSLIRVDIETNGGTTVYVLDGTATITIGAEHEQSLGSGLQVYIEPGHLSSETLRFDGLNDDFDAWNRDRVNYIATGYRSARGAPEFERRPLGVSELSASGRWIDYSGARYWQPDPALAYVPYRDGYWTHVARCGDVWVGRYGFEYTTTHYGRWTYAERHGWLWHYEPVWSPAWVAAVKYGPNFVWAPLGLDDRPVHFSGGASFQVGNLTFSLGASTLVPVEQVYLGYAHIQPARIELLPRVQQTDIQIWNIDVNNVVVNSLGNDFGAYSLYKSTTPQPIRGLLAAGSSKRAPRDVVSAIRASVGTTADFKGRGKKLAGPSARPSGKGMREVRLKDAAKIAKTQAGPGRGKAKAAAGDPRDVGIGGPKGRSDKAGGPPDKGNKGQPPAAKENGKGGPPDKGNASKNKGVGGPDMKDRGSGGPPDKGKVGGGPGAKDKGGPPDKGNKRGGPSAKRDKGGPPDKGNIGGGPGGKDKGGPPDKGNKRGGPSAKSDKGGPPDKGNVGGGGGPGGKDKGGPSDKGGKNRGKGKK